MDTDAVTHDAKRPMEMNEGMNRKREDHQWMRMNARIDEQKH